MLEVFKIPQSKKNEIAKFLSENNRSEYIQFIMLGLTYQEISEVLNVSKHKVTKTIQEILKLIGTKNHTYAVTLLLYNKIVPTDFADNLLKKYPKAEIIRDEKLNKRKYRITDIIPFNSSK